METKEKPADPITFSEAKDTLGVGWKKFRELKDAGLLGDYYIDPINRRFKYLSRAKVEELKRLSVRAA